MRRNTQLNFDSRAVHAGSAPDPHTNAVVPPISLSTTFVNAAVGVTSGYEYSRDSNPTRDGLELSLASLEGGERAFAFASGSAATTTVIQTLGHGAHVICVSDVYCGTYELLSTVCQKIQNVTVTYLDLETFTDDGFLAAFTPATRLVHLEQISNPTLKLVDIERITSLIPTQPEGQKPLVSVDSTFLNPFVSNPFTVGADVIIHSTTKSICGHSDVLGGAIVVRHSLTKLADDIWFLQKEIGAVPSPFDCFLALRSIKTLSVRTLAFSANALTLARFLSTHPCVQDTIYPGLESHPHFSLAKRIVSPQMNRALARQNWNDAKEGGIPFGGMVSFRIKGGEKEAEKFLLSMNLISLAESLGGVETLAELPCKMTHRGVPEATRMEQGITPNLIRMSVGLEDVDDLMADLDQALKAATEPST